jgi:dolichyl-diphosphooligosaccharide--protein glycosyltransferase
MVTSGFFYWILEKIAFPIDIKNICVFLAPVFAAFTSITAFFFTKEITNNPWAGLYSALFMAVVPGYT